MGYPLDGGVGVYVRAEARGEAPRCLGTPQRSRRHWGREIMGDRKVRPGSQGSHQGPRSSRELLCTPSRVPTAAGRSTGNSDSVFCCWFLQAQRCGEGVSKGKREACGTRWRACCPRTANEGRELPQAEARTVPEAQEALKELD